MGKFTGRCRLGQLRQVLSPKRRNNANYGEGIHRSLTSQPEAKYEDITESQALDLCIQRGVTNGKGLGLGLFATSQFILKNSGGLL